MADGRKVIALPTIHIDMRSDPSLISSIAPSSPFPDRNVHKDQ
jgi:hypothetical protein